MKFLAAALLGLTLSGCTVYPAAAPPPPPVAYAPAPAYYAAPVYYGYPAYGYYGPAVNLNFGYGRGYRRW